MATKKKIKPTPKKAPVKAAKKATKPIAKKPTPAKKAVAKKAVAKKAPAKTVTAKKAPVKKVAAKKAAAKPAPQKSVPAPAKKVAAKAPVAKAAPSKPAPAPVKATPIKKFTPKPVDKIPSIADAPTIVVEPITDPKFLEFVKKQKQRLLDLRDELVDAMTGTTRDTIRNGPEGSEASGSGMHQGDAGSDAYDRDFALSVLAKEQDALYEIEEALHRIKKGLYGICEMSGKRIPLARLEAIPFARLTVECQSQWEKEFGSKKFRPSGSVGFSGGGVFEEDEDSETVLLDDDED